MVSTLVGRSVLCVPTKGIKQQIQEEESGWGTGSRGLRDGVRQSSVLSFSQLLGWKNKICGELAVATLVPASLPQNSHRCDSAGKQRKKNARNFLAFWKNELKSLRH